MSTRKMVAVYATGEALPTTGVTAGDTVIQDGVIKKYDGTTWAAASSGGGITQVANLPYWWSTDHSQVQMGTNAGNGISAPYYTSAGAGGSTSWTKVTASLPTGVVAALQFPSLAAVQTCSLSITPLVADWVAKQASPSARFRFQYKAAFGSCSQLDIFDDTASATTPLASISTDAASWTWSPWYTVTLNSTKTYLNADITLNRTVTTGTTPVVLIANLEFTDSTQLGTAFETPTDRTAVAAPFPIGVAAYDYGRGSWSGKVNNCVDRLMQLDAQGNTQYDFAVANTTEYRLLLPPVVDAAPDSKFHHQDAHNVYDPYPNRFATWAATYYGPYATYVPGRYRLFAYAEVDGLVAGDACRLWWDSVSEDWDWSRHETYAVVQTGETRMTIYNTLEVYAPSGLSIAPHLKVYTAQTTGDCSFYGYTIDLIEVDDLQFYGTPAAQVANLAMTNPSAGTITATWTAASTTTQGDAQVAVYLYKAGKGDGPQAYNGAVNVSAGTYSFTGVPAGHYYVGVQGTSHTGSGGAFTKAMVTT